MGPEFLALQSATDQYCHSAGARAEEAAREGDPVKVGGKLLGSCAT